MNFELCGQQQRTYFALVFFIVFANDRLFFERFHFSIHLKSIRKGASIRCASPKNLLRKLWMFENAVQNLDLDFDWIRRKNNAHKPASPKRSRSQLEWATEQIIFDMAVFTGNITISTDPKWPIDKTNLSAHTHAQAHTALGFYYHSVTFERCVQWVQRAYIHPSK